MKIPPIVELGALAPQIKEPFLKKYGARISALLFSVAITAVILIFREQLASLRTYGYAGIFVLSVLGNATVIFPVPSLALVFASGSVLNPWLIGLVAGLGEPIGELTGYMAGYGGGAVISDGERFERLKTFMQRQGFLTIFVLSAIPNPLFDLAGIAAGMLRFPLYKFLLACWLGKTLKASLVAFLGSLSISFIAPWLLG